MSVISSRDNPRVRRWRALMRDSRERRAQGRAMIEGWNLVSACLAAGAPIEALILSESGAGEAELMALARRARKSPTVLADPVFQSIADAEAPAGIAAEIGLPESVPDLRTSAGCVMLDGIQDAGNVGAILRSAAAFGIRDAVLGRGCADAWSPKVLRAGAGAHFSLRIAESADLGAAMLGFGGRLLCTVPRGGTPLERADLSGRLGWLLGAEGRGVSEALAARAALKVTIPIAVGAESLNVAAAAALCFYEANRRAARS